MLLPLLLAGLLWGWDRWQTRRGTRPEARLPVRFGWLYAMSFIGCLTHPAMDWLNVYGIRLLEPFSSRWFYGDTLFIIDPWLWALLIASLWWSRRRERQGGEWTGPARIGFAAMLAYIGVNAFATWQARLDVPVRAATVIESPLPLWGPLRRETIAGGAGRYTIDGVAVGNCWLPDLTVARRANSQLDAFLFWSRAPFAVRADDGSVILYDARFYDPRARGRFSVALPDVRCEELVTP